MIAFASTGPCRGHVATGAAHQGGTAPSVVGAMSQVLVVRHSIVVREILEESGAARAVQRRPGGDGRVRR
eukprot:5666719-Prymnesium_polylepis.1